ncbi:DUF2970 domain-containing protein [Endozoicomonas sp. 8E]|uniref:DUF2970 domain-containing protein n=1 Tax=Endozoicomonas sp. 8E TaxID=3035692 RepID=UPI002938E61F|nr:DUF2970 domain-containing protein [Endozoicomonas sp. 8E]WOG25364.1 DUF2970 domain-containing protein [Endozoicomonas sp. 8E]
MAKGTGFLSTLQSALASAFGVQSEKNRARDFSHGRPAHFVIAGILGTLFFILILVLVVKLVLSQSG